MKHFRNLICSFKPISCLVSRLVLSRVYLALSSSHGTICCQSQFWRSEGESWQICEDVGLGCAADCGDGPHLLAGGRRHGGALPQTVQADGAGGGAGTQPSSSDVRGGRAREELRGLPGRPALHRAAALPPPLLLPHLLQHCGHDQVPHLQIPHTTEDRSVLRLSCVLIFLPHGGGCVTLQCNKDSKMIDIEY